jgi:hypothetical protein
MHIGEEKLSWLQLVSTSMTWSEGRSKDDAGLEWLLCAFSGIYLV